MTSGVRTPEDLATPVIAKVRRVGLTKFAAGIAALGCGLWLSRAEPQERVTPPEASELEPVTTPGRVEIRHGNTSTLQVQNESRVRLNYILASWEQVLEDVAEATGTHLVADEFPAGKFSRQDWNWYDKDQALAILGEKLAESGFELRVERDLLLLRRVHTEARADYLRAQMDVSLNEVIQAVAETDDAPAYTRQFDSIVPRPADRAAQPALPDERYVQQATYADDAPPTQAPLETAQQEVQQQTQPDVSATYTASQRTALDLARTLYETYRARAELVDVGPTGLPAFQVFENVDNQLITNAEPGVHPMIAPARPAWLTVEIDTDGNKLHMYGQERTLGGLQQLLQILDRPQVPGAPEPRLVAGDENLTRIGEQLAPELERLRQNRRVQAEAEGEAAVRNPLGADPFAANPILAYQDDAAQGGAVQPDAVQIDPNQPQPESPDGLQGDVEPSPLDGPTEIPGLLESLLGDVRVEIIQDLNLMILYGNERDIEAVMRVIRAIDQLAIGAAPEIHLLFLQYVNCEALAELLNEVYSTIGEVPQSTAQVQPTVNIIPVVTPNAILILAPGSAMEAVLTLAQELDREGDPQMEVQVFPLQNAVVSQVVTMLETFYADRGGLAPRILAIADVRTNNLIVQARPRDLAEVAEIILRIDRDSSPATARVKIIRLQNALADEVAEFLNTAIQSILNPPAQTGTGQGFAAGGGQAAQELRDSKAMVLEFLTQEGNREILLRSGLLSDVRINADIRTNNVMVTAPEASMPLIEELVRTLDMPSAAVADIKVFQLENADALAAVELLEALLVPDTQDEEALQFQLPGSLDASSSLIPMRFTADSRTNSIIAMGGADAMTVVEAILIRLDSSELRDRQRRVIKLRNSPAESVADALNLFLEGQLQILQIDPERISFSELLEQQVIVVPDPVTNNILIEASPRYFNEIVNMALQLDAEPPQVMIQALLVEVELQDTDEFGVELGFQDPLLFDRSVLDAPLTITETTTLPTGVATTTQRIISQTATPGFLFNNQQLGNNIGINPSSVGTQGLSNFALGRVNGDLGFGGLVLSASSESVSVLIRALSAHRNVRVHSRPQVSALDNIGAQIQVGQVVPVVNGVSFNNNQTIPIVEQQDSGIILTVQPRISPEGQIVMQFSAEKSQFQTEGVPLFTDAATGNVITSPIKDIITATTTIKVPDGQTVVVGGMITQTDDTFERKVPWLGDIPILGHAFRYDFVDHNRTELLIFLTPRIIHNCEDSEMIKQVEAGRIQFFVDEAEAIHGPIYSEPKSEFIEQGPVMEGIGPWVPPADTQEAPIPVPFPEHMEEEAFNIPTTVVPQGALEIPTGPSTPQQVQQALAH
jgi:type II secretory pathway component GspD/PulD (secretin)